jgi:LuxR family transcriptional regulator, maltose regulon positive regulatory protein
LEISGTFLSKTKLNMPPLVGKIVPRQKLLHRLDASRQLPFILVSAPAGYGKSVLINSYLETNRWPFVWISLDEYDNAIVLFLHYFLSAVQSLFPDSCRKTKEAIGNADLPSTEILSRIIADDINVIGQDFFLVLDDYSEIHNMEIHDVLSKILKYQPRWMHLIITTRYDPPLPLVTMVAKRQMAEIRVPDLRFTVAEAATLVRSILEIDVDDETIVSMVNQTEGWVTGLYLVAISHLHDEPSQVNTNQREYYGSINEYLLKEVCSRLPVPIQEFITRISILERFCAPLCEAVIRDENTTVPTVSAFQYLDWITQANLFLLPLDKEGHWYQFHRLFRQFLQRQLSTRYNSEEIAILHSRASIWYSQNQLFEESLQHALAAGDIKAGIQQVILFNQNFKLPEQWQQLDRLVHSFPLQIIESNPDLLFAEACVMYARFQLGKMPSVLDKVEKLLIDSDLEPTRKNHLQGEIAALRSYLYFWVGDYQSALVNGGKALARLPDGWHDIRELTKIQMADAMQMLGKDSPYASLIENWSKLYMNLGASSSAQLNEQMRLCFLHWVNADLLSLKSTANNIFTLCHDSGLEIFSAVGHYFMGIVEYYQNNLAQAEQHFRATYEKKLFINTLLVTQSAFGLAMIYRGQGQINKAIELVNATSAYLLEINETILRPIIQAFQAELSFYNKDPASTQKWEEGFNPQLLPPMLTLYYPHFTLLKILLARSTDESRKRVADVLSRLRYCVESSQNKIFLIQVLIFEALLQKSTGDVSSALNLIKQALSLAKTGGMIRLFVDIGTPIFDLLHHLEEKRDMFVQQIFNSRIDEDSSISKANSNLVVPLTDRELRVMELLVKRLTNKEIADRLVISAGTVKSHTIRIYQKLNVKNRRQASEKAVASGIVANIP